MRHGRVRSCGVALATLALTSAAFAGGLQDVERFLPANTFLYGGVEKLGPGFKRIVKLIETNVGFPRQRSITEMILGEMAEELGLGEGAATADQFAAATGLDPDGAAGIAWVLADPSYRLGRMPNENVLVILPVKNRARVEALLAEHILPAFLGQTQRICRYTARRLRYAKRRLAALRKEGKLPDGPVTWETLAAANPGLPRLRCPGGGEYTFGGPEGQPACSLHGREAPPRRGGPITRDMLGAKAVGNVTLVGGRRKGTGYAVTDSHLVISNNMNVLEDAVAAAAAAGAAPSVLLAPPGAGPAAGEARGFLNTAIIFRMLKTELRRELDPRRGSPQAGRRLTALLDAPGGLTLDARILQLEPPAAQRIAVAATWDIQENAATKSWLATPPAALSAWRLVPKSALFAVGTNLVRPTFAVLTDAAMIEEPALAAAVRLAMAGAADDGAFALTRGVFANEMPNMVLILRVKDRAMMDGAIETWTAMLLKELRAEKGVERTTLGGTNIEVRSLVGRRGAAFHFAYVGPFAVAGTSLEDVKAIAAIQQGGGEGALVGSAKYRRLEVAAAPANAVMFLDLPGLMGQFATAGHQRRVRWCNENCKRNLERIAKMAAEFEAKEGRAPADFKELMGATKGVRRRYVPTTCYLSGDRPAKYVYDANTGKVTCPRHGTLEGFRPVSAAAARRRRIDELILSAFGVSGLHLRLEGGQLKGIGTLIPIPQRAPARGSM